jgi:histidine triad (HIT) family protein
MATDCLFCKMVAGVIQPNKVYEDTEILAFKDINPQAPVHVLVVPKRHIASANDLTDADAALVGKLFLAGRKIASDLGVAESGYRLVNNCGADGGQSVGHLHLHVLGGRQMNWPPG